MNFFFKFENKKILLYPDSLSTDILVEKCFWLKQEMIELMDVADEGQMLMKVTAIMHKGILIMEDKMSWPPQPIDPTDDKISLPESLSNFMNVLSGKNTPCQTGRGIHLKLSIGNYGQLFSLT